MLPSVSQPCPLSVYVCLVNSSQQPFPPRTRKKKTCKPAIGLCNLCMADQTEKNNMEGPWGERRWGQERKRQKKKPRGVVAATPHERREEEAADQPFLPSLSDDAFRSRGKIWDMSTHNKLFLCPLNFPVEVRICKLSSWDTEEMKIYQVYEFFLCRWKCG